MKAKEPLGISEFLPPMGADELVRAAMCARALPDGALSRAAEVDRAVRRVKLLYPEYFRTEADVVSAPISGIRPGRRNRRSQ